MDVDPSTAVVAIMVEKQELQEAERTSSGLIVAAKGGGGGGGGTPVTPTFFREMLEDLDEPIPTVQQLESFGLFDQTKSDRLLAVYRETHPSPVSPIHFIPASPTVEAPTPSPPRRPSEPQHRHSLAVLPLPTNYDASTPSPLSPSASPRLNPFAFVRKATIRPRPSQRAKSASDVQAVPPQPTPALGDVQPFFSGSTGAEESASPRNSFSLSRTETVKENRAPRKLRKATAPKISIRTDDDYLLRPFTVPVSAPAPATTSPSPSPPPEPNHGRKNASSPSASGPRPPPIRLPSWRSSASSSIAVSPTSYTFSPTSSEHALPPLRPPSPVGTFPASIRREGALPPVEAKKRGSTTTSGSSSTDDYLADNERVARFSPRASRTRFGSTASGGSAPASPTSAGGVWGKLRLGGGKKSSGGSRPSSIASVDSTSTWEVVDGAEAAAGGPAALRSFEVLGRPASRPPTERSISYDSETAPGPLDSPNLSRILEQSEFSRSLSKRSSGASRPSTSTSIDSLAFASGSTTPNGGQQGVSAASSMTAGGGGGGGGGGRPGMPRSRPSSNLNLATASSFSSLRSHPPSPLAPLSPSAPTAGTGKVTTNPFFPANPSSAASTTSLVSGSWPSSRSSNRSRDSLFFSADGEGEGGSGEGEGEDGETPASSALEEEEDEAAPRLARTKGRAPQQQEMPLLERLVIEEAALAGRAV